MAGMTLKEARSILGIEHPADEREIKSHFRELAIKHHPDRGGDEKEFKKISEAYTTLITWGGKNIVAAEIESKIFGAMWNDWFESLSENEQQQVQDEIEKLADKDSESQSSTK